MVLASGALLVVVGAYIEKEVGTPSQIQLLSFAFSIQPGQGQWVEVALQI